jgi:hypothetical protein
MTMLTHGLQSDTLETHELSKDIERLPRHAETISPST